MEQWVRERVDTYLRHGGKTSRRAMVKRLIAILLDIRQYEPGVRQPPQIGRAHIHRYWGRFRKRNLKYVKALVAVVAL